MNYPVIFEGDREISHLVEEFQKNDETILCSYHLWEGLDIPGSSLSNVLIANLPFPPNDPVFDAKRKSSVNPYEEVDLPYMLLRLRQGIGRLIRTSTDKETFIWMENESNHSILDQVKSILPVEPRV